MIRPRTGFSAPSQTTLRYLRQLVFPLSANSNSIDYGFSHQCCRLRASAQQRFQYSQRHGGSPRGGGGGGGSGGGGGGRKPHHGVKPFPTATPSAISPQTTTTSVGEAAISPISPQEEAYMLAAGQRRKRTLRDRIPFQQCHEWYRQFRVMLHRGQLSHAKQRFLEAREKQIDENFVQWAGRDLMESYNRLSKHAEAPAIFTYLALFPDFVGTRSLNCCLDAYLIRKNYPLFMSTFKHYTRMEIVQPDHKTYELFIRCLLKVGGAAKARDVMKLLEDQRKPVTSSGFAAFLGGVKEKNASLQELEGDFQWIKTRKPISAPALYNIMIEEALEYGKPAIAKRYVDAMIADGVKPNEKTFAAFLRVQARAGDWRGVRKAMQKVREKGMVFSTRTLNSLLDQYADMQELEGLESFFDLLCQEEGFPSTESYNIMIRTNLAAVDEAGVNRWVANMRKSGFEPTAATFNTFFQDLRCSNIPRALMFRVYNSVFNMDRNKVDEISRDILYRSVWPVVKEIKPPPPQNLVTTPETGQTSTRVAKEMDAALKRGNVRGAMNAFREASSFFPITREVIAVLARAYTLIPDTQIDVPVVLPKSHDRAHKIKEAVIGFMISATNAEAEKVPVVYTSILNIIHGAYKFMEANDIPISHNISNQAAATLINRQDPIGALHIMNEVSKTRWGRRTGWDIAGLTVLSRAYLVMGDLRGVTWVVDRLVEGRMVPDDKFMEYLRRGIKSSGSREFRDGIEKLIVRCKEHKENVWVSMHQRATKVLDTMGERTK
jgi:hypothetical protein